MRRKPSYSAFVRCLLASVVIAGAMCFTSQAGHLCDLLGKGLDKAATSIKKIHKKVEAKVESKGKLLKKHAKHAKGKFKRGRAKSSCQKCGW